MTDVSITHSAEFQRDTAEQVVSRQVMVGRPARCAAVES
jgi:hypothetical protein